MRHSAHASIGNASHHMIGVPMNIMALTHSDSPHFSGPYSM